MLKRFALPMHLQHHLVLAALLLAGSCRARPQGEPPTHTRKASAAGSKAAQTFPELATLLSAKPASAIATLGEDDGTSLEMVEQVMQSPLGPWTRIPAPAGAHPVVCGMAWFQGAVWVSFGNKTISTDGAQVHSWRPDRGWKLELDWDRGGAPGVTHEQSGQGIARLRVIGDELYATDADAPNYGGFGITKAPLEGYIFVAGADGFGALREGALPPKETLLVPLAFHVFDLIEYGGELVASGGTLAPPGSRSPYPGGLFLKSSGQFYNPRFFPGSESGAGVVRVTFMHRFRGRLYMGFQNNEGRARWDLGVLEGSPVADASLVLGRVTEVGGWRTRQFASDRERLYWIATSPGPKSTSQLFQSADGLRFASVHLGEGMGQAQDMLAHAGSLLVLTDRGLFRRVGDAEFQPLLANPKGSPFKRRDGFCTSPILATPLGLFAGASDGSGLYRSELPSRRP